jgi:predicted dehydrogenase
MNVGIIGASGIGKHHAKWFHLAGCRIAAFTGTSPERCQKTAGILRDLFGFDGRSYTDYRRMLDTEPLDIVCVCSPPEVHLPQIGDALGAGLHVYCEKPVTWVPADALPVPLPSCADPRAAAVFHPALNALLTATRTALAPALEGRSVFGLNTQYVAVQAAYRTLYEAHRGPLDRIDQVYFLLESKGISGRYNSFEGIWIDMSPHALSQIIGWRPDGALDPASVACAIREAETTAAFRYDGVAVEAVLRKNVASTPKRRFGVNGFLVDYEGRADPDGVYRTFLTYGDQTVVAEDLMQHSIHRFLEAIARPDLQPFAGPREALKNLEMSVMIMERGKRVKESLC